jgi:asparagine synthase (glutamine-hydrolysing)
MAGLCGLIGDTGGVDRIAAGLAWTGEETTSRFDDGRVAVVGSYTDPHGADQPVRAGEDALLWVRGSVFGSETAGGYRSRDRTVPLASYCAERYERRGRSFVAGLNGDFVGVLYDRAAGTASVFTDRLGLRDIYHTRTEGGSLAFSTRVQSLSRHPGVTPAFDPELVVEYLGCGFRTFGLTTPLAETRLFPPGAVTTVDLDTLGRSVRSYWEPVYDPDDVPFATTLDRFVDRFGDAVAERFAPDRRYGLLLSGGADSRLVLAATDATTRERLTAYHMTGWMSREARVAERTALTADIAFEPLWRDREYHPRALRRIPRLSNFVGTFQQAHAEGFAPRLREAVDEVVTGSFADTNWKGYSFPNRTLSLGRLGTVSLPAFAPMDDVERYVEFWTDPPRYLDGEVDPATALRDRIRETPDGLDHHGVGYGSPPALFVGAALTPRTNGSVLLLLQSLRQHVPAWSPFVDDRLIDLYLSTPLAHFARGDVIARAVERFDPDLAAVATADRGVSLSAPRPVQFAGDLAVRATDRHLPVADPPAPHLSNRSWPDAAALIRRHPFVREALDRHADAIRRLPFLDGDAVAALVDEHRSGTDHADALYGLLTLLEAPVTDRILRARG